ncbi:MAG: hypothetical protein EOO45_17350 [Flavobacterium sp.]|nr:MAG: hypothetical protein EOO45_17350 [Flavobacterium sp.]
MKELILSPSKKKSKIEGFPSLKNCLTDIKGFNKVLLPIVKLDGGIINEKWEDVPFTFIVQNVDVSRMDFRLENGKYQLLSPLNLRKLDEYDESDIKREYLQTSVDKVEKIEYLMAELYSNEGLLLYTGSYSHAADRRLAYSYGEINGTAMPVTKTVQYYLGNGEWLDSEIFTYHYDADGFLEKTSIHQPARDIKVTERIKYKKTRTGFTASKELAPHQMTASDEKLGVTYTKVPFNAVFREKETIWDADMNGWYIEGKKDETMAARQAKLIHLHAFNHFYDQYSGFLKYTCNIEERDKIAVKVIEKDGFPDTIEYTFSCPGENSVTELNYIEKGNKRVILEWGEKYTLEHLGDRIQVTNEYRSGKQVFELPGQYTLQQTIMMLRTQSYLWCNDFEQERLMDRVMQPNRTKPLDLRLIYRKTENGIERIVQEVQIENNRTEGNLRTDKPHWLQSDETPRDPDGKKMEFVAQLDHSNMFGTLYLFFSEKHQLVSQIFQCT